MCIVVNDSVIEDEFQYKAPSHDDFELSKGGKHGLTYLDLTVKNRSLITKIVSYDERV